MPEKESYSLLLAMLEPHESMEDEFNAWYDTEHIPERRAVPGFLTVQRFVAPEGSPKYLAIYDLENLRVLESEAYREIGPPFSPWSRRVIAHLRMFIRETFTQVVPGDGRLSGETGAVFVWAREVSAGKEAEYRSWYEKEWLPKLSGADGLVQARRFRSNAGAQDMDIVEFRDMGLLKKFMRDRLPGAGSASLFKDAKRNAYARHQEPKYPGS